MTKVKEKAKKGLVDNVVVEKTQVVKNIPIAKAEETLAAPGNASRAYRQ